MLCQFSSDDSLDKARPTLKDYVPIPDIYPAGRLDRDSEGLLLLTDDGKLQNRISSPKSKLFKTYWVQVEGDIDEQALIKLRRGIDLKDGFTAPAKARKIEQSELDSKLWEREPPIRKRLTVTDSWVELQISEGRNRQVRRMTAAVGFPTLRLIRCAIGQWTIDGLALGAYTVAKTITNLKQP